MSMETRPKVELMTREHAAQAQVRVHHYSTWHASIPPISQPEQQTDELSSAPARDEASMMT